MSNKSLNLSGAHKARSILRSEFSLLFGAVTAVLFLYFNQTWLGDLGSPVKHGLLFIWLFGTMVWLAFSVVRHADSLAVLLGEPYGTLILTMSVITIEVFMISAVMLHGDNNPTLARDTLFSVLMIVLNGIVGVTLLIGALRHKERAYNLKGASAYLSVIIPLAGLGIILPIVLLSKKWPFLLITALKSWAHRRPWEDSWLQFWCCRRRLWQQAAPHWQTSCSAP